MNLTVFHQALEKHLTEKILPFWEQYAPDPEYGGFRGRIANDLTIDPRAPRGLVLNARILWTFAKASRTYPNRTYAELAQRAYEYLTRNFLDPNNGGFYWMVDYQGRPLNRHKLTYGQSFALYGLSEYARTTGDSEALQVAIDIFQTIEAQCRDEINDGYFDMFEEDWRPSAVQRLSDDDPDAAKTMNTHLHLIEAYANLLRCQDSPNVRERLRNLVELFLRRIVTGDGRHLRTHFTPDWRSMFEIVSFGHEIESSWLLTEAAEMLGDSNLIETVNRVSINLAESVLRDGQDTDGGIFNEAGPHGLIDDDKHWWPQAEAVVGFLNAWRLTGDEKYLEAAQRCWSFIERCIIDHMHGEWFWKVDRGGRPDLSMPKVSEWKCPYHNSRMCFEAIEREF